MKNMGHDWTEQGMFDYPDDTSSWQDTHSQKNKKNYRKSQRKVKKIIIVHIFIIIIIVAMIALRLFWQVNTIVIQGVGESELAELEADIGLKTPMRLSKIDKKIVRQKIESNPHYIVEQQQFEFPFTYRIAIHERHEYAVVQCLQQYVYIDLQGIVLDVTETPKDNNVLIVRGLSASGFSVNEGLAAIDEYQFYVTKEIFSAMEESEQRGWFSVVDVTNAVDISLFTTNNIWVHLGQPTELKQKIMGVAVLLQELELEGQNGGKIEVLKPDSMVYAKEQDSSETTTANQPSIDAATSSNDTSTIEEVVGTQSAVDTDALETAQVTPRPTEAITPTAQVEESQTSVETDDLETLDENSDEISIDMIPEEVDS